MTKNICIQNIECNNNNKIKDEWNNNSFVSSPTSSLSEYILVDINNITKLNNNKNVIKYSNLLLL